MNLLTLNDKNISCGLCGEVPEWIKGKTKKYCPACHVIRFIESRCCHTKGRWSGVPFKLLPWQIDDVIKPVFNTLKPDGSRKYRIIYIEIPKKNGKTEFGSALALYGLVGDGELGGEVYSAAGDIGQAGLIYEPARIMVENKRSLEKRLKVIDSKKRIIDHKTNSFYQVLSAEAFTKHGINPSVILFDELHAQPNRDLWDVLTEGTDTAREQQLVIVLTTAGLADPNSIGFEIHKKAVTVKENPEFDPEMLPVLYCADGKKDDLDSPKTWARCNPSLNHVFKIENLAKNHKQGKEAPVRWNNFLRFRLNIWVNQLSRWMPIDKWDDCSGGKLKKSRLLGRKCYAGLDLSSTTDIAALVLVFPSMDRNELYEILPFFWIPKAAMKERSKRDGVPYDVWTRAGLITATEGNVIDYNFILDTIEQCAVKYNLSELAFDRWGSQKLIADLVDIGFNIEPDAPGRKLIQFGQGFASMTGPTKDLLTFVLDQKIRHFANPVLRWMADNMIVRTDPAGNIKPDKGKSTEKIDGMVAFIMALDRAIKNKDTDSIYTKRGVIAV